MSAKAEVIELLEENEQLKQINHELLEVCESVQFVINQDKDGDYFICAEAKNEIEKLNKIINKLGNK